MTKTNLNGCKKIVGSTAEEPEQKRLKKLIADGEKMLEQRDEKENTSFLSVNRNFLFSHYNKIVKILQDKAFDGRKIELVIGDDGTHVNRSGKTKVPYSYSPEECKKLCELQTLVDRLSFSEFTLQKFTPISRENLWDFDDVINTNLEYQGDVDEIENFKLSPFKTILDIHRIITYNFKYKNGDGEDARTFLTIVENSASKRQLEGGMVCSGFASAGKAYVDKLNNPNLKCEFMGIAFYDKTTKR